MNKYFLILMLMFFSAINIFAEKKELSLDECLKLSFDNSKNVAIAKSKVEAARLKTDETATGFYPQFKFNASYSRLSEVDKFSIPGFSSMDIFPVILDNYSLKLSASQPLFTGFRLDAASEIANYSYLASKEDYLKENSQLTVDIKTAYWSYYKGKEQIKVLEENIQQTKAHLVDLENFLKTGLATNNDILKLKVQLSNLLYMKLEAETGLSNAQISLNTLMGLPNGTELEVSSKPATNFTTLENLQNYIKSAYENRTEVKAMKYRIDASKSAVKMSKAGWYPQIALAGNFTYANPNQRIFPSKQEFNGTWDVSLVLSYDIWNWGITGIQSAQAEENLMQAKLADEQILQGITMDVSQNYYNLLKSKEKIDVTKFGIEQAEENLRVTNQRFKNGVSINSDLIDAEVAWLTTKINYTTAVVDYEIAISKMEKALGIEFKK